MFGFSRPQSPLAVLEFAPAASSRSSEFLAKMIAVRDEERAKLPPGILAELEQLDLAIRSESLDGLWAAPPHKTTMELSGGACNSPPFPDGHAGDGLDDAIWNQLGSIAASAYGKHCRRSTPRTKVSIHVPLFMAVLV